MLLGLKRYEMATGRVVFRHARPRVGAFFHTTLVWVEQALPSLVAGTIRESVATVKKFIHRWIARGIVRLSARLNGFLKHCTIQHTRPAPVPGRCRPSCVKLPNTRRNC